jgi:hypothetical protein
MQPSIEQKKKRISSSQLREAKVKGKYLFWAKDIP